MAASDHQAWDPLFCSWQLRTPYRKQVLTALLPGATYGSCAGVITSTRSQLLCIPRTEPSVAHDDDRSMAEHRLNNSHYLLSPSP